MPSKENTLQETEEHLICSDANSYYIFSLTVICPRIERDLMESGTSLHGCGFSPQSGLVDAEV